MILQLTQKKLETWATSSLLTVINVDLLFVLYVYQLHCSSLVRELSTLFYDNKLQLSCHSMVFLNKCF